MSSCLEHLLFWLSAANLTLPYRGSYAGMLATVPLRAERRAAGRASRLTVGESRQEYPP
jgi:hypothetical protein